MINEILLSKRDVMGTVEQFLLDGGYNQHYFPSDTSVTYKCDDFDVVVNFGDNTYSIDCSDLGVKQRILDRLDWILDVKRRVIARRKGDEK